MFEDGGYDIFEIAIEKSRQERGSAALEVAGS